MFYALTLQLRSDASEAPRAAGLQEEILAYGPYVVLASLPVEVAVFLSDRVRPGRRSAKPAA